MKTNKLLLGLSASLALTGCKFGSSGMKRNGTLNDMLGVNIALIHDAGGYDGLGFERADILKDGYITFQKKLIALGSEIVSKILVGEKNTVVSAYSIYSVITMVSECSSEEIRQKILDKLGVTHDEMRKYMTTLYGSLISTADDTYVLDTCNSIWIRNDIAYNNECVENLSRYFLTSSYYFDNATSLKEAVNRYVYEKSRNLIDLKINFSKSVVFIIMNVLYLKDSWCTDDHTLEETKQEYSFLNSDGTRKTTKLLVGNYEKGKIVDFPTYRKFFAETNNNFRLTFLVPKEGVSVDDIMTKDAIDDALNGEYVIDNVELNEDYYTNCIFPRFEAAYDLKSIFPIITETFGIEDKWPANSLSLFDETIFVTDFYHAAKLKVDETGIIGAAVSIAQFENTSQPRNLVYDTLEIDKAFGFVVSKDNTNLFTGKINSI